MQMFCILLKLKTRHPLRARNTQPHRTFEQILQHLHEIYKHTKNMSQKNRTQQRVVAQFHFSFMLTLLQLRADGAYA